MPTAWRAASSMEGSGSGTRKVWMELGVGLPPGWYQWQRSAGSSFVSYRLVGGFPGPIFMMSLCNVMQILIDQLGWGCEGMVLGFALANESYFHHISIIFPSSKSEALCASNQQDYVFLDGRVSQRCVTSQTQTWEPLERRARHNAVFAGIWMNQRMNQLEGYFPGLYMRMVHCCWESYVPKAVFLSWLKPFFFPAKEMAKTILVGSFIMYICLV